MCDKGIELSPRDAGLYFRAASLAFQTSNSREKMLTIALQYLTRAAELDAGNSMVHLVRGNVLVAIEKPVEAMSAFNEAIRTNPQNAHAYNARGKLLFQRQQNLPAMNDLSKAVLLAGNSIYGISFKADLDKFVKESGASARSARGRRPAIRPGGSKGDCPRCRKSFETSDVPIPQSAVIDGVFQGRSVAEVMECIKECGAMYCWPGCCEMRPCRCGSQQGFEKAVVFVM
jgi:tetratricopeptide (TPR) repeat protein